MAIIGVTLDRENPEFTIADFLFWMPQYRKYLCYYSGKILVGQVVQPVSVYSYDYSILSIGSNKIDLTTVDGIIYTGSMIVGPTNAQTTYSITLNTSTKILSLDDGTTITQCLLRSEGEETFNHMYELANDKIFYSIYGTDWKFAMALCIAHYLTLMANQMGAPSGNTLQGIAGGGNYKGILESASIGEFSKTYKMDATLVEEDEAKFWNLTSFGAELMALLKTKAIPSIMVVTSNPIPGAD